jgi:hypothetical protein
LLVLKFNPTSSRGQEGGGVVEDKEEKEERRKERSKPQIIRHKRGDPLSTKGRTR